MKKLVPIQHARRIDRALALLAERLEAVFPGRARAMDRVEARH